MPNNHMSSIDTSKLLGVATLGALRGFGVILHNRMARLETGQAEILAQLKNADPRPAAARAAQAAPAQVAPAQPTVPDTPISIATAAVRGRADAKLTMVEFSDFECPFCGRYSRDTFGQIAREYIDTGKIQYAFRHYPIESLHPHAFKAAEAAECAREQGKFWPMHDRLFAHQEALTDADLLGHATAVGLKTADFQRCVSGPAAERIRQDQKDGNGTGMSGTPMFYVGNVQPDGRVRVRRVITGAAPYAQFKSALDELLASAPAK